MGGEGATEVVIVGAGPVGLTLACELRLRGVACRVLDRALEPARGSRATDIHARTLEIFEELGIADEVVARGKKVTHFCSYDRGEATMSLDLIGLSSAHPYAIALPQERTEALLTRRLVELGGRIERGVAVVGVESGRHGVTLDLRHADGRREVRGVGWVVGCDGIRSTLRQAAGISFDGVTLPDRYLVVDGQLDWALPDDRVHLFCAPGGFVNVLAMPGEGNIRVMANLGHDREPADHVATMRALMRERMGVPAELGETGFSSTFRIAQRVARRYRAGRLFLAGDAAHTWSPLLGQGMNVGIQDAYNLAWKLALVVRGTATEELLDTYEAERRPVAKMVMHNTHLMHRMSTVSSPLLSVVRDRGLRWIQRRRGFVRLATTMCSELATQYRSSPIVGGVRSAWRLSGSIQPESLTNERSVPRPGDRAPNPRLDLGRLHDRFGPRHTLVVFSGIDDGRASERQQLLQQATRLCTRHGDELTLLTVDAQASKVSSVSASRLRDPDRSVHDAFAVEAPTVVLVRPDRHLAFRGGARDRDELAALLVELLDRPVTSVDRAHRRSARPPSAAPPTQRRPHPQTPRQATRGAA